MAGNLTKGWIQYLKNNQIAAMQSNPKTGRINYKRKPTTSDVVDYLQNGTNYDDKAINNAIDTVIGNRQGPQQDQDDQQNTNLPATYTAPGGEVATNDPHMRPGNPQEPEPYKPPLGGPTPPKKYNNDDATDVEPRYGPRPSVGGGRKGLPAPGTAQQQAEPQAKRTGGKVKGQVSQTPNAVRKRQARANRKGSLNEDFKDDPGEELSEKEVEAIFKAVSKSAPDVSNDSSSDSRSNQGTEPKAKVNPQEVREEELGKLKTLIAKTMSAGQRKQLWDELKGATLAEAAIKRYEVENILKDIVQQSKNSYSQSKITIDQLQDAWKKAGYPEDTGAIAQILQQFGYDSDIITKVMDDVLGNDDDNEDESSSTEQKTSQAVVKIAAYIKKAGLTDEITQFMQENFGAELTAKPKQNMFQRAAAYGKNMFSRKATTEDVRRIFTAILREERTALPKIAKSIEYTKLGRNKK